MVSTKASPEKAEFKYDILPRAGEQIVCIRRANPDVIRSQERDRVADISIVLKLLHDCSSLVRLLVKDDRLQVKSLQKAGDFVLQSVVVSVNYKDSVRWRRALVPWSGDTSLIIFAAHEREDFGKTITIDIDDNLCRTASVN